MGVLILALLALWVVLAVRHRKKTGGCGCGCPGCTKGHEDCKK